MMPGITIRACIFPPFAAPSRELLLRSGFEVLAVELALPNHIFLLARVP